MLTNIKKLNNILITNDDGFDSIGINLLKNIETTKEQGCIDLTKIINLLKVDL